MFKADDLINEISTLTPNKTANGQLQMMNILEPIFESKFHTSLKNATSNFYSLTEEKTGEQKFQEKINETRKTGKRFPICYPMKMKLALFFHLVIHIIKEIGTYCQRFLKHPKLQGVEINLSKLVKSGTRKTEQHTGKLENYVFEKEAFQKYTMALPSDS